MEFLTIKELVNYSRQVFEGKNLRYTMTTNASLLTDEIVEFLIEHEVDLVISLDDPREIHNKN